MKNEKFCPSRIGIRSCNVGREGAYWCNWEMSGVHIFKPIRTHSHKNRISMQIAHLRMRVSHNESCVGFLTVVMYHLYMITFPNSYQIL